MGNRSAAGADALLRARGTGPAGGAGPLGAAAALAGGALLIGAVLAGNALVCASVAAERALQTPTNYFVVSLAAADLLLALLVLPLFVYSEVSGRPAAPRAQGDPAAPLSGTRSLVPDKRSLCPPDPHLAVPLPALPTARPPSAVPLFSSPCFGVRYPRDAFVLQARGLGNR